MQEYLESGFQVDDHNLVIEHANFFPGGRYCRSSNFAREKFGTDYLELYGLDHTNGRYAVLTSGMNAIGCVMQNIFRNFPEGTIVCGSELYCDTPRTIKYLGCKSVSFDVRNSKKIVKYFEENGIDISLFFVESCTNPSGQMFDFNLIKKLKEYAPSCIFCVDNTWCTGLGFNPFEYDVDVVIESTTKYISGGKCIGGIVLGRKSDSMEVLMDNVDEWIRIFGQFVGKDHCHFYRQGLKTIKTRLEHVSDLAIRVARYLETRTDVNRVMYPTLPSHPTYNLAKKFLKLNPGCICFNLSHNLSNKQILKKVKGLDDNGGKLLKLETSYGSKYCKIDPWPRIKDSNFYDLTEDEGEKGIWLRLAIGSESEYDETIQKLDNTLIYINSNI